MGPDRLPKPFSSLSYPHRYVKDMLNLKGSMPNEFQIPTYRWIPNIYSSFYHPFLRFISHGFLVARSTYPGCWAWAAAESDKKPGPLFSVHTQVGFWT